MKRKKWKERKKKNENKEKNKKRRGKIPGRRSKGSEKGKKQFSINERKRTEILHAKMPLEIILDWKYPTPHEQRGKD